MALKVKAKEQYQNIGKIEEYSPFSRPFRAQGYDILCTYALLTWKN